MQLVTLEFVVVVIVVVVSSNQQQPALGSQQQPAAAINSQQQAGAGSSQQQAGAAGSSRQQDSILILYSGSNSKSNSNSNNNATTTTMTLCRGTLLGPPPTGHVRRFIDSGVFVLPVGGPSRSLLEVRGAVLRRRCVASSSLICHRVEEAGGSRVLAAWKVEVLSLFLASSLVCYRISEDTLGSFSAPFRGFFVLHCHGV